MTAEDFMRRFAEIATPVETYVKAGYSLELAQRWYSSHFCTKREIPLVLEYGIDDILLDIIEKYNVERDDFEMRDIKLYARHWNEIIDDIFLGHNVIPVGDYLTYRLVINRADGCIELRPIEAADLDFLDEEQAYRCARNGECFLEAMLYYIENSGPIFLKKKAEGRRNETEEEVLLLKDIAHVCTELAGGSQFTNYWYFEICVLDDY